MARGAPGLKRRGEDPTLYEWASRFTKDPTYHQLLNLFSLLAFVLTSEESSAQEMASSFVHMHLHLAR